METTLWSDTTQYPQNTAFQLKARILGDAIQVLIDDIEICSVTDSTLTRGTVAMYSWGQIESRFDNVRVCYVDDVPMHTVVDLETGQSVADTEGNLYRYQGAAVAGFNLGSADFGDSSKWVPEIGIPDYAEDTAYTIEYVMLKDTDVDLIPNVTIVKVDTGHTNGGVVGNRYLYVGASAEVVLSEQDYTGPEWEHQAGAEEFTYLSSFENYSYQQHTWTSGGGWLKKKTYHTLTTQIFGQKDYYTHTLKADYPIEVSFIQGPETPSINIASAQGLYLQETVTVPDGGTISLTSGADLIFEDAATVLGASPTIVAGGSVRANLEGGDKTLVTSSGGDIEIRAVYDPSGNQSDTLVVGLISAAGNVILHAPGGIQAFDDTSLISGNLIELDAPDGGIGSSDQSLRIDSALAGSGGVTAMAAGDIYILETDGDLKLAEPRALENLGASVHSAGDVYLYVADGAILDAFYEEFTPPTEEEINELNQKMQLTGELAQEAAETAIRSQEGTRTQLYHEYWKKYRDAKPGSVASEHLIESINTETGEITVSQPHGLQTGDEVFFSTGVDLTSETFTDLSRWEEIVLSAGTVELVNGQIVRLVKTGETAESLYRYVGEDELGVDLGAEDFDDFNRWVEIFPDYNLFADYPTPTGTVPLHQGEQVRAADGRLYRYLGVDLIALADAGDFDDAARWAPTVLNHDLPLLDPAGSVNLQTNEIVRPAEGLLYRYLGAGLDDVLVSNLIDHDFSDTGTWESLHFYDMELDLPLVDLQLDEFVRTADGNLYRYLVDGVNLGDEVFGDSSRWLEIAAVSGALVQVTNGMLVRTAEPEGEIYLYVGENPTETSLGEGAAYYAVVTGDATLQLATSRYDAVIRETPLVVGITVEPGGDLERLRLLQYSYSSDNLHDLQLVQVPGTLGPEDSNTVTRTDGSGWDADFVVGQSVKVMPETGDEDLGIYTIEEISTDGTTLTLTGASFFAPGATVTVGDAQGEKFRYVHETYGDGEYDPNLIFHFAPDERQELIDARSFSSTSLSSPVASSLFDFLYPAAASGSSPAGEEVPNVIGQRITLVADAGKIGRVEDSTQIDLADGFESLSEIERQALAMATAEDVVAVSYVVYRYNGADGEVDLLKTNFKRSSLWERQVPDHITTGRTQWEWLESGDLVQVTIPLGPDGLPQFGVYQYTGSYGYQDLSRQDYQDTDNWVPLAQFDVAGGKTILTQNAYVGRIEGLTVEVWNDVDLEEQAGLAVDAQGAVAVSSPGDLHVESIDAGGAVRLLAGGSIQTGSGSLTAAELSATAGQGITLTRLAGPTVVTGAIAIQGDIQLAVPDSDASGDDLVLAGGAIVLAATGSVTLRAGDDLLIAEDSRIVAATGVWLAGDSGNVDTVPGATIEILGRIDALTARIDGGVGNDEVTVGDELGNIRAQLTIDGGDDDNNDIDRLILRDSDDGRPGSRQAGQVELAGITGFGMPTGARISYQNFEKPLELTLSDGDGYEVTFLGTPPPAELAFGAGEDRVVFDCQAETSAIPNAILESEDRDADGAHETIRVSNLGPMTGDVYLAGADDVLVELGAGDDQLAVDLVVPGVWLEIQGYAGHDQVTVRRIGHYTFIEGGDDLDEVRVEIPNNPTDAENDALWDYLACSAETLTVDNEPYASPVNWKIQKKNNALLAGGDKILRTDGVGKVHLIAAAGSLSTLEVEEIDGLVTAAGHQVDLMAGPTPPGPRRLHQRRFHLQPGDSRRCRRRGDLWGLCLRRFAGRRHGGSLPGHRRGPTRPATDCQEWLRGHRFPRRRFPDRGELRRPLRLRLRLPRQRHHGLQPELRQRPVEFAPNGCRRANLLALRRGQRQLRDGATSAAGKHWGPHPFRRLRLAPDRRTEPTRPCSPTAPAASPKAELESFLDLAADSDTYFTEDFNDGFSGWKIVNQSTGSNWYITAAEHLAENSNYGGTYLYYEDGMSWTDYELTANIYCGDNDGVGLLFRYRDHRQLLTSWSWTMTQEEAADSSRSRMEWKPCSGPPRPGIQRGPGSNSRL